MMRSVEIEPAEEGSGPRLTDPPGYGATLRCLEEDIVFGPGESRQVFFEVRNTGGVRWPGGMEEEPLIRLGYRWLSPDGSVKAPEGLRSPFPAPVAPAASAVVPLGLAAPEEAGSYLLEVDVVHEHVRWFEATHRTSVTVARRPVLPPAGPRLRETSRPRIRRLRRLRIPRIIHRIWLGDTKMPADFEAMGATFANHHPDWEMRLWSDADLLTLGVTDEDRARTRTHSELSNLVRYEILRQEGGLYVDTDVECRRDFSSLLRGVQACAALELPGRLGTAVLAAVPGHPVFKRAATEARETLGLGAHAADANGPYFLSLLVEQEGGVTIFPTELFYPSNWDESERAAGGFPDAFTVRHGTGCQPHTREYYDTQRTNSRAARRR